VARPRFQFDEHVPQAIAHGLRRRGYDVATAGDLGLRGIADPDVLATAFTERRVLVTHDPDFLRLHGEGRSHAGIAFCRANRYGVGHTIERLVLLAELNDSEELLGWLEYL
jgi:hypothetical protein